MQINFPLFYFLCYFMMQHVYKKQTAMKDLSRVPLSEQKDFFDSFDQILCDVDGKSVSPNPNIAILF